MKISKDDKIMVAIASIMVVMLVTLLQFGHAQKLVEYPQEDQVIVCVNGNVTKEHGLICRTFNIDGDGYYRNYKTLDEAQRELYGDIYRDTFEMDIVD